jgi:hypothetical protein
LQPKPDAGGKVSKTCQKIESQNKGYIVTSSLVGLTLGKQNHTSGLNRNKAEYNGD